MVRLRGMFPGPFHGPDAEAPLRTRRPEEETKQLRHPREVVILFSQDESVSSGIHRLIAAAVMTLVRTLSAKEPGSRGFLVEFACSADTRGWLMPVTELCEFERLIAIHKCEGCAYLPLALRMATSLADTVRTPYHVVLLTNHMGIHPRSTMNAAAELKGRAIVDCIGLGAATVGDPERILERVASTNADGSKRMQWVTTHPGITRHAESLAGPIDLRSRAQRTVQTHASEGRL